MCEDSLGSPRRSGLSIPVVSAAGCWDPTHSGPHPYPAPRDVGRVTQSEVNGSAGLRFGCNVFGADDVQESPVQYTPQQVLGVSPCLSNALTPRIPF